MASVEHLGGDKYKIYVELGTDDFGKRRRRSKTVTVTSNLDLRKKTAAFEAECLNASAEDMESITFDKFLDRWWKNHVLRNLAQGTQINYEKYLKHFRNYFGKMQLNKIRRFHIDDFFVQEEEAGRKSLDAKKIILQSIFGKAIEWEILTANPTQRYKLKKTKPKKPDVYSAEELEIFFKLLDTQMQRDRLMFLAASLGALRRGEVLGIGEDVIDFKKNSIDIVRSLNWNEKTKSKYLGPTKGRNERTIIYPKEFMKELRLFSFKQKEQKFQYGDQWELIDGVDLLFRTYENVMHPNYFSQLWKKACADMGIRVINLHSLRHSSATYLHRAGMNEKALQEFLGHAKFETTMNTYVHTEKKDLNLPAEKFTKFL